MVVHGSEDRRLTAAALCGCALDAQAVPAIAWISAKVRGKSRAGTVALAGILLRRGYVIRAPAIVALDDGEGVANRAYALAFAI